MSIFQNDISISKSKEEETTNKQDTEYFKKRCEILENGLFKLQTQNKKLEDGMKKLQEMNAVYAKVTLTYYRI
jgi:X-X-X-Leu-X-X-Gly heptad repeat protein